MRKTIRKYRQQDVPDDLLRRVLDEAARTQTMGNLQLYSVIVTRDAEQKARLAPAHFNQEMVTTAPVVLTIVADFRRTSDWCLSRRAVPGYGNFLSFLNAATDALLYTQTLSLLLEREGLGLCFLGTTIYNPQAIIDALALPTLTMPVATLTVGWPDEDPKATDRLPVDSFVHNEQYTPYTEQRINAFYEEKESLEENKEFCRINGKETLAQVFTDCRYTKDANEQMSHSFIDVLRRQGFSLCETGTEMTQKRPESLECDVVRFQNKKDRWVAFVGLWEGRPYEIFTGLMDEDEGIMLPKSISNGHIIRQTNRDGSHRYDFQFENKRGYKITIEGLSGKFDPEYWNYAKLISGVLRYGMPLESVIKLITSLTLDSDNINSWTNGVARALKRYLPNQDADQDTY